MNKTIRYIDEDARIILPDDVKNWGWKTGVPLCITAQERGVLKVVANTPYCSLCGRTYPDVLAIEGGALCMHCLIKANERDCFQIYSMTRKK